MRHEAQHKVNVAHTTIADLTKSYISKFRSNDRTRGWTLDVLQDDWPCSRLIIGRVIKLIDPKIEEDEAKTRVFRQILESAIDRYELTIIPKHKTGYVPMRYRDGFRLSVFVEALITGLFANIQIEKSQQGAAFQVKGPGNTLAADVFALREDVYKTILPEAMRSYLSEEKYEECIVAGFLDFRSGVDADFSDDPE